MIQRYFKLSLNSGGALSPIIHVNQHDQGEQWIFTLFDENGNQYIPSSGAIVGIKSDKKGIINSGTVDAQGRVVINETAQMTAAAGKAEFELLIDSTTHGTANFIVDVEPRPGDEADISESDLSLLERAIASTSEAAIIAGVQEWMDENLTNPTNPVIDETLSLSGAAADAKKTGDEIDSLKSALDDIEDQIEGGTGDGLTSAIKSALMQLAQKVAFKDTNGQTYVDDLYDALYPTIVYTAIKVNKSSLSFGSLNTTQTLVATTTPRGGNVTWSSSNTSVATVSQTGVVTSVGYGNATITATCGSLTATCSVTIAQATVTRISAVFSQVGVTVYNTDSLDSLKSHLTVTAEWSNGTTSTVASADYTLSGTLTVGVSTITVSYGGQSTTFNVNVTDAGLTTSGYITVANETLTDGYIDDNGETVSLADNHFIDKFYEALPFATANNSGIISSGSRRSAYYDANKNFLSRDYITTGKVKGVSNTNAVYEKVGFGGDVPTYVFLLKDFDESIFVNSNSSINASGELDTENGQIATDLINLESGCDKCVLLQSDNASGFNIKIAFYDANQNFISRFFNVSSLPSTSTAYGDIPSNAKYYRMSKTNSISLFNPLMRGI